MKFVRELELNPQIQPGIGAGAFAITETFRLGALLTCRPSNPSGPRCSYHWWSIFVNLTSFEPFGSGLSAPRSGGVCLSRSPD